MPARDLDTHHLFAAPSGRAAWEERAREVRRRVQFGAGLWPMPVKTPLRPRVTNTIELPDILVESVALQTLPGFWLCGNLYRPQGSGPFPAILNPHGHWANGRLERETDVAKAPPPPAAPGAGRADLVNLAASLARQGFLVFAYDMVGYNETNQVQHQHFGTSLEHWLWGISELGLQTWNSVRALDYLCTRKDVDAKRIGATGASGGGTQVFVLAAIDERVKVSVPVNMVSSSMQGGCICENGPGLRVGTDNPEIAATFAPKPQLLVSCTGDWTRNNLTEEGPAIRKVYELYGAGDRLQTVQFNYQHNYNVESREAMYAFFRKWLKDAPGEREKPLTLEPSALKVARPAGKTEEQIASDLRGAFAAQADSLLARSDRRSRESLRAGLALALGQDTEPPKASRARGGGRSVLSVGGSLPGAETLTLAPLPRVDLWGAFYSTYNVTPVGERVGQIVDAYRTKARAGGTVDLVGFGEAGAWTLLAAAVLGAQLRGAVAVDLAGFPPGDDRAYVDRLFAPGLRRAGGLLSAASLTGAATRLCLYGLGDTAPWEPVARRGVRLDAGRLAPDQIAAWLAG